MADQDHDGSHIKGLIVNFFDHLRPSLLLIDGFLQEFITPIMKATKTSGSRQIERAFYTLTEFDAWSQTGEGQSGGWSSKYYKRLGRSKAVEAKESFAGL